MQKSAIIDLTNSDDEIKHTSNEVISESDSDTCISCKTKVLKTTSKNINSKSETIKPPKKVKKKKRKSIVSKKKDLAEAHKQRRKSKQETLSYVININTKISKGKSKKCSSKSKDCLVNSHCKCCKCLKKKFNASLTPVRPLKKVTRGYIKTVLDDTPVQSNFERPVPKCLRQCTSKIRRPVSYYGINKSPLAYKHRESNKCPSESEIMLKLNKKYAENQGYPQIRAKYKYLIDEIEMINEILARKQTAHAEESIARDPTHPRLTVRRRRSTQSLLTDTKKRNSRTVDKSENIKATARHKKKCLDKNKLRWKMHDIKKEKKKLDLSMDNCDLSDILSEDSFRSMNAAKEDEYESISLSSISVASSVASPAVHEVEDDSDERAPSCPSSSASTLVLACSPGYATEAATTPRSKKTSLRRSTSNRKIVKSAKTPKNYSFNNSNSQRVDFGKSEHLTTGSEKITIQPDYINSRLIDNNWQSYQLPIDNIITYIRQNIEMSSLNLERIERLTQNSSDANLQHRIPTVVNGRHQRGMSIPIADNDDLKKKSIIKTDGTKQDKYIHQYNTSSTMVDSESIPTNIKTESIKSTKHVDNEDIVPKIQIEPEKVVNHQVLLTTNKTEAVIKTEESDAVIKKEEPKSGDKNACNIDLNHNYKKKTGQNTREEY